MIKNSTVWYGFWMLILGLMFVLVCTTLFRMAVGPKDYPWHMWLQIGMMALVAVTAMMNLTMIRLSNSIREQSRKLRLNSELIVNENMRLISELNMAQDRVFDCARNDDGQAFKEATKYLQRKRPDLAARL